MLLKRPLYASKLARVTSAQFGNPGVRVGEATIDMAEMYPDHPGTAGCISERVLSRSRRSPLVESPHTNQSLASGSATTFFLAFFDGHNHV